ncbi:MAG: protein kinase domain-containing protein, partial [Planctomycetia bacterium]
GNLLLDQSGILKISDLGLAVINEEKDGDPLTLAQKDVVLGTADFVAPEQVVASHDVDIRADIYSLGATFYFLLCGAPPFPEAAVSQKLMMHLNQKPKPIRSRVPSVVPEVAAILEKMMAKNPRDRFATPADVSEALEPFGVLVDEPLNKSKMASLRSEFAKSGSWTSTPSAADSNPAATYSTRTNGRSGGSSGSRTRPSETDTTSATGFSVTASEEDFAVLLANDLVVVGGARPLSSPTGLVRSTFSRPPFDNVYVQAAGAMFVGMASTLVLLIGLRFIAA